MSKNIFLLLFFWFQITIAYSNHYVESDPIIFMDGHAHMLLEINNDSVVYYNAEAIKQYRFDAMIYALPINSASKYDNNIIEILKKEVNSIKHLENINPYFDIDSIIQCKMNGELSIFFCVEYFQGFFNKEISKVKEIADLGVKYITLIDNNFDEIFENEKLTSFGKELIAELDSNDIIIDISHLSESKSHAVIDKTNSPVIASHSCIRSVTELEYNLSDSIIRRIVKNNGLILISFNTNGLFRKGELIEQGIVRLCQHINYVRNLVGIDYIGIGTDLQANGKYVPKDLYTENTLNNIVNMLYKMGYTKSDIEKIFYKNIYNFFSN